MATPNLNSTVFDLSAKTNATLTLASAAATNELSTAVDKIFNNAESVARYSDFGPQTFTPGLDAVHRMVVLLLSEFAREDDASTKILVLGAGGGREIKVFANARPNWSFVGVDPFQPMLDEARKVIGEECMKRVELIQAFIPDSPAGPFDGATCLMTLHFLRDDNGEKLVALKAIKARLKPGAPLLLVDNLIDKNAPDCDLQIKRFASYPGVPPAAAQQMTMHMIKNVMPSIGQKREEELLAEAGFTGIELFYKGLTWCGYVAYA